MNLIPYILTGVIVFVIRFMDLFTFHFTLLGELPWLARKTEDVS